jgi:hypothetical protein
LNIVTIIFFIIGLHRYRYLQRKTSIQIDNITTSPSDYTIELDNLPEFYTEDMIKEGFKTWWDDILKKKMNKIKPPDPPTDPPKPSDVGFK